MYYHFILLQISYYMKANSNLKEIAKALYLSGVRQKDIAERLSVSPQTITKWVKEGEWDKLRAARQITRTELVNKTLASINQLLDSVLESKDPDAMTGLGDKLTKLAGAIEKLDKKATVIDIIEVTMDFEKYLITRQSWDKAITDELLKLVNKLHDAYIQEKLKA